MAPPKKTASAAETNVASNFFQRGKKASLAQRPATGKSTLIKPSIKRTKVVQEELSDEIDDGQDSDEEELEHEQDEEEDHEEEEVVSEDDLTIVHDDEIQSEDDDDSDRADFQKKGASVKVPAMPKAAAAAPVSKASTRSSGRKKVHAYIAPNVGDIHIGCKLY